MENDAKPDNAGVHFPPPFLFAGGLLVAWLLDKYVVRLPFATGDAARDFLSGLGAALAVAGIALAGWGMITFKRAHTAIVPFKAASRLVESGPYKFTRNPMYTGMASLYLGLTGIIDTWWAILFFPLVLLLLRRMVIAREERYLSAAFGQEYESYKSRVRRGI